MDIRELFNSYLDRYNKRDSQRESIFAREKGKRANARDLRKEADALDNEADEIRKELVDLPIVDWVDEIVKPLAEELRKATGKKCVSVIGPCGICGQVYIYLYDDQDNGKWEQPHLSITIQPGQLSEEVTLLYETGEIVDSFAPGTIGAINGCNNVTAVLPTDLGEIVKLLREYKPDTK